jgi:hypothetical protein
MLVLYRSEIRREMDRPTNSTILRYVGRRLQFDAYVYGYPDGTFFALNHGGVPLPEELEQVASKLRLSVDASPDASRVRQAVVDALVAEALLQAPEHLADMATPGVDWLESDVRELQRRHTIAEARVVELTRIAVADLRLRAWKPRLSTSETVETELENRLEEPVALQERDGPRREDADELELPVESELIESRPSSRVVTRIQEAVSKARDEEVPQRLPAGMRRQLGKLEPGCYVVHKDELERHGDLSLAMVEAQALGTKADEAVVVHWDGEWPVVVRRYSERCRVVYRVEAALRRHVRAAEAEA